MARLLISSLVSIAFFCGGCATTESKETRPDNAAIKTAAAATAVPAAAAAPRPQPDWVSGESKQYPRLDYITARTQAASTDEAAQLAKAKMSRYFMADLAQYDMSERQAQASGSYQINRTFQPADAMTVAAPEIERILDKITVVDQWYDSNTRTHHALAAMARNTGLGYLRTQIQMLDTNTADFLKNARESSDPFTKMGMTALAWRAQQLRASLQESMSNVDLTRRGIEPQWQVSSLQKEIDALLVNLKIQPVGAAGDANGEYMANVLDSALKVADLKPASAREADYRISATVERSIAGEENNWAVGQANIKLILTDKENKERGHKEWTLRVPGISEDGALSRAQEKSDYTLKKEMRNSLIDMALGD